MNVRLAIYLKDGRSFVGVYHPLCAHARIQYAKNLPDFAGLIVEVA